MIDDRWFRQGHIDEQETCLITSNETYLQYTQTQKALEQKKQEEEKHQAEQERNRKNTPPEVQEVLDKGNEFLDKIHRSNDAIPGEEISAKISRMELIVEKIFERAQKHPPAVYLWISGIYHSAHADVTVLCLYGLRYQESAGLGGIKKFH